MEPITVWVERARNGRLAAPQRQEAFGRLVERFQDMVTACTYDIVGDFHQAQDLAQETFLSAYLELDALRQPAAVGGWLRQMARRKALRLVKERMPQADISQIDASPAETPQADGEEDWERHEQEQAVHRAIAALPAHERSVIGLFYLGGYTLKQIAAYLAVPVDAVKKRLQRGRDRLRARMESMEENTAKKRPAADDLFSGQVRDMVEALAPLRAYKERDEVAGSEVAPLIKAVRQWEDRLRGSNLSERVADMRYRLAKEDDRSAAERLAEVLPEALGLLAAHCQDRGKTLDDDALAAAVIMHRGQVAKGDAGLLPALFLNALVGQGTHLIAVDGERAAFWAQQLSRALDGLGLEVAHAGKEQSQRLNAYGADITCVRGFDVAMDVMLYDEAMRPLFFAAIDRIETVMVHQVKVPLVLSGTQAEWSTEVFVVGMETTRELVGLQQQVIGRLSQECRDALDKGDRLAAGRLLEALRHMQPDTRMAGLGQAEIDALVQQFIAAAVKGDIQSLDEDASGCYYSVNSCNVTLNERAYARVTGSLATVEDEKERLRRIKAIVQGVRALVCYEPGRDYVVIENKVYVADADGTPQVTRRFSEGLHQALEAKEGVEIQPLTEEVKRTTFQAFLRQYPRLAGTSVGEG